MPDNQELLDKLREMKNRGLLDQLGPEEKASALAVLGEQAPVERQKVLRPKKEIEAEAPGFFDSVVDSAISAVTNPVEAGVAAVRGAARAFNPLPMVNAINSINPYSTEIVDDLEAFESLFNFPIVRGAELAARMFVPEDERPPLTTYAQLVEDQRQLSKDLSNIVPGVEEAVEAGIIAGSTAQLASAGLKAATALAKGRTVQGLLKRSAKQAKKTKEVARDVLRQGDGPMLDAIVKRPEKVRALVEGSDDLTISDLAIKLKDDLEDIGTNLGRRVGDFRSKALADNKTRLQVPEGLAEAFASIRNRTTFQGKSILPPNISKALEASERAAKLGVTTPNQAVVWVDMIDDVVDFGSSGKAGSNAIKQANIALGRIRAAVKDTVRQTHPGWAAADDNFSGFVEASNGLIRRLESDSAESLASNLFGKNKTPLRARLERSLDFAEKIDSAAKGHGAAFFDRLADMKAAQGIKDVQLQVSDPIQDNVNRIVKKWRDRGLRLGAATGYSGGAGLGGVLGEGGAATTIGLGGAGLGGTLGAMAGGAIGKAMANPMRVLKSAQKANRLSKEARDLARDMSALVDVAGSQAPIAFLDLVGPLPAVKELITFFGDQVRKAPTGEKVEKGK